MRNKEIVLERPGVGCVEKIVFTIRPMVGNIRYDVCLEPVERGKIQEFLQNLPKNRDYVFLSRERWPVQIAKDLFQLKGEVDEFYIYEASPQMFQPQSKFPVVKINLDIPKHCEALEHCECKTALQDELCDGCKASVLMLDGKVVSYATYRTQSPVGPLIAGVWTDPKHRGKGYGKSVVSSATAEILKKSKQCRYEVVATNIHSVQICKRLGYKLVGKRHQCGKYDGVTEVAV